MEGEFKIKIFGKDGECRTTVYGDRMQCLANVQEGETFEEVSEVDFTSLPIKLIDKREVLIQSLNVESFTGNIFDADERSQERMARAILVMKQQGVPTTSWKLNNNEIVTVTVEELEDVLVKASVETSNIWLTVEK